MFRFRWIKKVKFNVSGRMQGFKLEGFYSMFKFEVYHLSQSVKINHNDIKMKLYFL